MAIETLRPNGTLGSFDAQAVGAASMHAALADESDSTYVKGSGSGTFLADLNLNTYTLQPKERVKQVRIRVRSSAGGTSQTQWTYYHTAEASDPGDDTYSVSGSTVSLRTGSWRTFGIEVADQQAVINGLVATFHASAGAGRCQALYFDLDVWEACDAVEVLTPSGLTDDASPPVSFKADTAAGFSNGDGSPDSWHRQMRIFRESVYTAPGFDPASGSYEWQNDAPSTSFNPIYVGGGSGSSNYNTTELERDVTYRAYIRYGKNNVAGQTLWADWAYSEFTVAPPSSPPSLLLDHVDKIYAGTSPVTKVYHGSTQIWTP